MKENQVFEVAASEVKVGQVIETDFGRSYVTGVNVAKTNRGLTAFVVLTFIVNDATEKQSFDPLDKVRVLWDE